MQRSREASRRLRALALAFALCAASPASAEGFALSVAPERSTDGVYRLLWSGDVPVEIEEARAPDFGDARVIYRGADRSSVLTGRSDGTYHYRVSALDGESAEIATASVTVEHHPLSRAFAFFGVGLVVFGCTVALVARGADEEGSDGR